MARRPGDGSGRLSLTPEQQRIAGWLVAAVLIAAIAILLGILGGNGDGTAVDPQATPSPSGDADTIVFGTQLDLATGSIVAGSETTTFTADDTFAYALPADASPPAVVYVGVTRTGDAAPTVVQAAATDGEQPVPSDRPAVAFQVPAANLLGAWGPGSYEMRIFADPTDDPIGVGSFTLTDAPGSTSAAPSPEASAATP